MPEYKEEFRVENGVLHVRLSGDFPNQLFQREESLFQPLIDACSKHHCTKALVDAREVNTNFGIIDLFRAGKDVAALSKLGLRVAFLAQNNAIDRFFEDVSSNRGGKFGMFTDMETARNWIKSQ